jgi:pimeloyl-ACP methyl ester carboxylesterase
VISSHGGSVTISLDGTTAHPGTWGLAFDGGYVELGDVLATGAGTITYQVRRLTGTLLPGTAVVFDRMAFAGDPAARNLPFEEVLVPGPVGDYPAWLGPGIADRWVVFVHDLGTDRTEALRLLPTVADEGLTTLVITLRNDDGAPRGGGLGIGTVEWADLEAAVDYAIEGGASDVVLVGYGAGGSIVESFMRRSRSAGYVAGIVLDDPLLDPEEGIDRIAAQDHVPGFVVGWSKTLAALRFGIDWGDLDHLAHAGEVAVPTLILHAADDPLYSVAVSRAYAAAAPLTVDLIVVPGAGHGEAWNADPAAYESAVAGFLGSLAAG